MTPRIRGSVYITGTGSVTLPAPACSPGDLLVAFVHHLDDTQAVTAPAGWTLITSVSDADHSMKSLAYWKTAAGSDAATSAWSVSGGVAISITAAVVENADPTSRIAASATDTSTDLVATIPSVAVTRDGSLLLASAGNDNTTGTDWTTPAGWTEQEDQNDTPPLVMLYRAGVAAGASSTATTTLSVLVAGIPDHWCAIAVAINPVFESPGRARYYLYDDAGRSLGEIPTVDAAAMAWGEHGPETATVTLPKHEADGTLNPWLHHTRLAPGGRAALLEIDARPDIPHVFLGKVKTAPDSGEASTVAITAEGPWTWLNRIAVPAETGKKSAAGRIVRDIVASLRGWLRLDMGTYHEGPGLDLDLNGGSFWDTVTGLEGMTNERLYLTAVPGTCRLIADWHSQLGARWEGTLGVTLESGVNCTWSTDNALDPDSGALILVGQSFLSGASTNATVAVPPPGPIVGKRAALGAAFTQAVGAALGGGRQALRPDLVSRTSIEAAALADAQRNLSPTAVVTLRVLDLDLRAKLVPGCLVTVKIPDDAVGYFRRSVGQVGAIDYTLEPEAIFTVTLELWAQTEGGE